MINVNLVFEIGNIANIELSKKTCLATLFFDALWSRIVVTANSLYEFFIILSLKIFCTKFEL